MSIQTTDLTSKTTVVYFEGGEIIGAYEGSELDEEKIVQMVNDHFSDRVRIDERFDTVGNKTDLVVEIGKYGDQGQYNITAEVNPNYSIPVAEPII